MCYLRGVDKVSRWIYDKLAAIGIDQNKLYLHFLGDYVLYVENNSIRRMRIRSFRKMIYENHFNKDYLEVEQKKNELEKRIAAALKDSDNVLVIILNNKNLILIYLFIFFCLYYFNY